MKALEPREVSGAGRSGSTVSSEEQPEKQSLPIDVRFAGRRTDWRSVHDWKA